MNAFFFCTGIVGLLWMIGTVYYLTGLHTTAQQILEELRKR